MLPNNLGFCFDILLLHDDGYCDSFCFEEYPPTYKLPFFERVCFSAIRCDSPHLSGVASVGKQKSWKILHPCRSFSQLVVVVQTCSRRGENKKYDSLYINAPTTNLRQQFMTGSVVGKRFYKQVTTREAHDGNGWTVMPDYNTLKTSSRRPLKFPTLALAKAIAAE